MQCDQLKQEDDLLDLDLVEVVFEEETAAQEHWQQGDGRPPEREQRSQPKAGRRNKRRRSLISNVIEPEQELKLMDWIRGDPPRRHI